MESILLLCAVVIVICIVASRLSQRLGVPALLLFLALGMLFGSDGLFRIPFDNFEAAERICSVALIFIMFYGGFGTRWEAARPAAAGRWCCPPWAWRSPRCSQRCSATWHWVFLLWRAF